MQIFWIREYRELLNEDVVEKLIRHEAEPSALSGFETTSAFNNFRTIRAETEFVARFTASSSDSFQPKTV